MSKVTGKRIMKVVAAAAMQCKRNLQLCFRNQYCGVEREKDPEYYSRFQRVSLFQLVLSNIFQQLLHYKRIAIQWKNIATRQERLTVQSQFGSLGHV